MYDFKQLSPADFEELIRDLLQKDWGTSLESFKSGRDSGIDLRYSKAGHNTIIQCKRYVDSAVAKLIRDLQLKELPKIQALKPDRYVLATALLLNPADKDKIKSCLAPYIKETGDILGASEINGLLVKHPSIETSHFKLWLTSTAVLERVLHNATMVQTDFDVDRVRRNIPLYVQNRTYPEAMSILKEHRFVIISGVPGIGKTTLADMLLFAHLEASFEPVIIQSNITEGRGVFKPDQKQIFYFDDFLGQTFLGDRFDFLGRKEDSAVLDFMEMIARSKHARLILTTREHILQNAFQISERFQRQSRQLRSNRCVLEMESYSLIDRARILYNHIFFSSLPEGFRDELLKDRFYLDILKHRNFNPRLIEWLSRYANVKSISVDAYQAEVMRVLENPEQLWKIAFEQQISNSSRSLLLALYSMGGSAQLDGLKSVWKALHTFRAKKYNWRLFPEDWERSLRDLEGGFLQFDNNVAFFVNPSVRDFFDAMLDRNSEYLTDLLSTAASFSQVIHIWALARSDKGKNIQEEFLREPERILKVVEQHLHAPFETKVQIDGRPRVRQVNSVPEVRLLTIISIAYRTHSGKAVDLVKTYSKEVLEGWQTRSFDFDDVIKILIALDRIDWSPLAALSLAADIRTSMVFQLTGAGSGDFESVLEYIRREKSNWSEADQEALEAAVNDFFDNTFEDELQECSDEEELNDLSATIKKMGEQCDLDIEEFQDRIDERAADFVSEEYDDDEGPRNWERSSSASSEFSQEIEVDRLFGGLKEQ